MNMKSMAIFGVKDMRVIETPMPVISDYSCLVHIRAVGFCNCTDVELIEGRSSEVVKDFPLMAGHEGAGDIAEVGLKVRNFSMGEHILFPESGKREQGYFVSAGHYSEYGIVQDYDAMLEDGVITAGEMSRITVYPRKIPADISFTDAGVLVPLRETCSAVANIGVFPGAKVLVYGDGPNALGLAVFSKLAGAQWLGIAGHHEDRIQHLSRILDPDFTVNTHEKSVPESLGKVRPDFAIVAVGSVPLMIEASRLVKPCGKVVLYSALRPGQNHMDLNDFANSVNFQRHNFPLGDLEVTEEVTDLIRAGKVNPKDFYSHTVPLEDFRKAYEMTIRRDAFKVIVEMP